MSLSKEKAEAPRQPKCTRCRHHGLVVAQKGHAKLCPFARCTCWKCTLITERTRINGLQRKLRRDEERASRSGQPLQADTGTSPMEAAQQQPAPGPMLIHPRPIRRPVSGSPSAEEEEAAPETAPCDPPPPSPNPLFWADYGPVPPQLLHLQVRMPAPFPLYRYMVNMPWSPVPPGLYEGSLSPLVPPYPYAPPHPPPFEPGPPMDFRPSRRVQDEDEDSGEQLIVLN